MEMAEIESASEKVSEYASTVSSPLYDLERVGRKRAKSYAVEFHYF